VIEPRVYRAAFLPALLATVVAMFSLESRPPPLPQGLAADVLFDGDLAAQAARSLARRYPDRRPGGAGDLRTADAVAASFRENGFAVERQRFADDNRRLENVIGRRAGRSRRQVVVLAGRDASSVPEASGSAADTAALLEMARVFQGRPSRKTLVLASVDGSTLGQLGTRELVDRLDEPKLVDAVLVVSDLAASRRRGSMLVPWSNDSTRAGIGLQRTVADSMRQELDTPVGSTSAGGQLARMAFPVGVGAQGLLLERGLEAVRISGSGELPPSSGDRVDKDRLGGLGRTTLRTVTALDEGPVPEHGPDSYVVAVSQVMPGWALAGLALAFLIPSLVAAVDAFARARRRGLPVAPWLRWLAAVTIPFAVGLALAHLLALVGATPEPPPAPVAPSLHPLSLSALAVLVGVGAVVAAVWSGLRRLAVRSDARLAQPAAPGAAVATALVIAVTLLVLWVVNPYATLVLVPAAHLWMLATMVDPPPTKRARALLIAGGLLPPLLVAGYYLLRLSMDPLTGAWYLLLLVTGHSVGLITALIGCVLLGALGAVVTIARAREEPPRTVEERQPVYGPGAHAGPGSLGGTGSALRR
jgi:hypothetical protein